MDTCRIRLPEAFDDQIGYWTATPDWDALERALGAVLGDAAPWREGLRRLIDTGETLTLPVGDAELLVTVEGEIETSDAALAERLRAAVGTAIAPRPG